MTAFCSKFISDYGSQKINKIGKDLPKLLAKVYCHVFMVHNGSLHFLDQSFAETFTES